MRFPYQEKHSSPKKSRIQGRYSPVDKPFPPAFSVMFLSTATSSPPFKRRHSRQGSSVLFKIFLLYFHFTRWFFAFSRPAVQRKI